MKILSVLQAQSVKAVRVNGSLGYLPDASAAIAQRYNFAVQPEAAAIAASLTPDVATGEGKPIIFSQGHIELHDREILVDTMSIFQAGIVVATRMNTRDSDSVIEDLLVWAAAKFGVTFDELKPSYGYASQLDFRFDEPLSTLLFKISQLGKTITSNLSPFWDTTPSFELASLIYSFDRAKHPQLAPMNLRIDRRAAHYFDANVFWSDAPLSTDNHVAFLTEFESVCHSISA